MMICIDEIWPELAPLHAAPDSALGRLARLWPRMDSFSQEGLRDYLIRLTESWVTYCDVMTEEQKQELMVNVAAELERRANGLEELYRDFCSKAP